MTEITKVFNEPDIFRDAKDVYEDLVITVKQTLKFLITTVEFIDTVARASVSVAKESGNLLINTAGLTYKVGCLTYSLGCAVGRGALHIKSTIENYKSDGNDLDYEEIDDSGIDNNAESAEENLDSLASKNSEEEFHDVDEDLENEPETNSSSFTFTNLLSNINPTKYLSTYLFR